jgi:predicted Zn-dependent peptidase
MSSRLFQEIRERRGLAYDVTSFLSTYRDAGYLGVYVATSAEWATEVMAITSKRSGKLQRGNAEELRRAKGHTKVVCRLSRTSDRMIAWRCEFTSDVTFQWKSG